eukprot:gene12261-biopygen7926
MAVGGGGGDSGVDGSGEGSRDGGGEGGGDGGGDGGGAGGGYGGGDGNGPSPLLVLAGRRQEGRRRQAPRGARGGTASPARELTSRVTQLSIDGSREMQLDHSANLRPAGAVNVANCRRSIGE